MDIHDTYERYFESFKPLGKLIPFHSSKEDQNFSPTDWAIAVVAAFSFLTVLIPATIAAAELGRWFFQKNHSQQTEEITGVFGKNLLDENSGVVTSLLRRGSRKHSVTSEHGENFTEPGYQPPPFDPQTSETQPNKPAVAFGLSEVSTEEQELADYVSEIDDFMGGGNRFIIKNKLSISDWNQLVTAVEAYTRTGSLDEPVRLTTESDSATPCVRDIFLKAISDNSIIRKILKSPHEPVIEAPCRNAIIKISEILSRTYGI